MAKQFRKKNAGRKKQQLNRRIRLQVARSRADKVLAQGTGKTAIRAFGGVDRLSAFSWDAFHPRHAPLPRSIGPYTVVRTTNLIQSSNPLMIFGSFSTYNASSRPLWTNIVAVGGVNEALPVNGLNNSQYYTVGAPTSTSGGPSSNFTCVPAAVSVQIMNPNALQTTNGILASAVCPAQYGLGGNTQTYASVGQQFISYFKPRLLSAGKLALRGVQMNSYPLSMSDISQFRECAVFGNQNDSFTAPPFEWLGSTAGTIGIDSLNPMGWAPMVVHNPGKVVINYLVTVEWRVRFDIANPAVSSHKHHGVSTDQAWDTAIRKAVALGHGVMDIAERVANYGAVAAPLARRAQLMLMDG